MNAIKHVSKIHLDKDEAVRLWTMMDAAFLPPSHGYNIACRIPCDDDLLDEFINDDNKDDDVVQKVKAQLLGTHIPGPVEIDISEEEYCWLIAQYGVGG